jgi:TPR repeat protein
MSKINCTTQQFKSLRKKAHNDIFKSISDANTLYKIGKCYQHGTVDMGVKKDLKRAARFFKAIIEQCHHESIFYSESAHSLAQIYSHNSCSISLKSNILTTGNTSFA